MALADLYACLKSALPPAVLLTNLTEAIARHLQVKWVQLRCEGEMLPSLVSSWPAEQTIGELPNPSDQICVYPELQGTPYEGFSTQGIEAIATVPILVQGQSRGTLCLGAQGPLPSRDSLEDICPPLQLALEILVQHYRDQRHRTYQEGLRSIQQVIDETQDITSLLNRAIALLRTMIQADEGDIALLKSDYPVWQSSAQLPTATLSLTDAASALPSEWPLKACAYCQAAWHKAPEVWHTADTIETLGRSPLPLADYPSLLMAPLLGGQGVGNQGQIILGFVILMGRSPRQWPCEDIQFIEIVTHQLSQTLIHRQALQRVQSLVERRTSQLTWSLEVQAKLGKKMRQQIQQLQYLNRLKDDFLSTVSHELNTPLATMKLAVKMLKQPGRSPEKQRTYLNILEQELDRESKLIHDLLQLQQAAASEFAITRQRLTLYPVLRELVKKYQDRWLNIKQLQLCLIFAPEIIKENLQLETDPEHLINIINELLTNAGKYATPNSTVQLRVEYHRRSPARIRIQVCNDGVAIEAAEQPLIFEKFRRGTGMTEQAIPGTGLGLALVKTMVEHLGGTITVSSEPNLHRTDHRTCFTVDFPQAVSELEIGKGTVNLPPLA